MLYNGLFSLGANFPEWWTFNFSRNFPDLEIHDPDNLKISHERHFAQIKRGISTITIVFHSPVDWNLQEVSLVNQLDPYRLEITSARSRAGAYNLQSI